MGRLFIHTLAGNHIASHFIFFVKRTSPVRFTKMGKSSTKAVQAAVLVINFTVVIITCYIYDMNKWIGNDKAERNTQDNRFYQGFWRKCIYKTVQKESVCDTIDEWFFSPNLPNWMIAGRVMVGFAILGGFISTLGFLMGSELSTDGQKVIFGFLGGLRFLNF